MSIIVIAICTFIVCICSLISSHLDKENNL